jgi:import inner membrane translocase subunit TIM23
MLYNGINSTIGYARGKHDSINSIAAGTISGMVFKSTRGLRPMMISGGIVGSVAAAWAVSISKVIHDRQYGRLIDRTDDEEDLG